MLNVMLTIKTWGGDLLILLLPVLVFCLRVRPKLTRALPVLATGCVMVATALIPMYSMAHEVFLIVWIIAELLLLAVHTVAWVVAIIKKPSVFVAGGVLTGVAIGIPCAILGNYIALAAAVIYLVVLLYKKQDLSCPV